MSESVKSQARLAVPMPRLGETTTYCVLVWTGQGDRYYLCEHQHKTPESAMGCYAKEFTGGGRVHGYRSRPMTRAAAEVILEASAATLAPLKAIAEESKSESGG